MKPCAFSSEPRPRQDISTLSLSLLISSLFQAQIIVDIPDDEDLSGRRKSLPIEISEDEVEELDVSKIPNNQIASRHLSFASDDKALEAFYDHVQPQVMALTFCSQVCKGSATLFSPSGHPVFSKDKVMLVVKQYLPPPPAPLKPTNGGVGVPTPSKPSNASVDALQVSLFLSNSSNN